MLGGAYLCFEGFEKLAHKFLHSKEDDEAQKAARKQAVADANVDLVAYESQDQGAVRTDFILSEIIAITLGIVADSPLPQQVIAVGHRSGNDPGRLRGGGRHRQTGRPLAVDDQAGVGRGSGGRQWHIARGTHMMKGLSVVGTAAMFLVGGGFWCGIAPLHHAVEAFSEGRGGGLTVALLNGVAGVIAGAVVLAVVTVAEKLWRRVRPATERPGRGVAGNARSPQVRLPWAERGPWERACSNGAARRGLRSEVHLTRKLMVFWSVVKASLSLMPYLFFQ